MKNLNENELSKAISDGFIHSFFFLEEKLHSTIAPEKGYFLKDIQIRPIPCLTDGHIVYRIITPDGLKGTAIHIPGDHLVDF
jgi:hypothetical protein